MKITDVTNLLGLTSTNSDKEVNETVQPKVSAEAPIEERKTLLKWSAQSRSQLKNMDPKKIKTLMIIGIAVCVLLVAMQEFFLILGVLSLIFVSYALTQTPPDEVDYEITNQGVKYDSIFYPWANMRYFFFTNEVGLDTIAIDMLNTVPTRLFLTVSSKEKDKVTKLLSEYVNYLEEQPKTFMDKAYDSVMDKLDLETSNK